MKSSCRLLLMAVLTLSVVVMCQYKVTTADITTSSYTLSLQYIGKDQYYGNPKSPIIKELTFKIQVHLYSEFYFKITDAKNKRYEIPQGGVYPVDPDAGNSFPFQLSDVLFDYKDEPFEFTIRRRSNREVLFSTVGDKYIQIGTEVASGYLYGLGERFHETFRKKDGRWTIFNRDRGKKIDRGEGYQTYGYYPYYLMREVGNSFHINYLRSSNAMDVIKSTVNGKHYLTYKVIGGVLDFRFMLGDKPEEVVREIHYYSGVSAIPPFWALGYQQSKWGYKTVNYLEAVIQGMEKNGIPLETIWSDIDYMDHYQDFTIDEARFPLDRMAKITEKYHYVPIIDSEIMKGGFMYKEGHDVDLFVKDGNGKEEFVGVAWPGKVVFPDFLHPNASAYWQEGLRRLYEKVKFSGIWLDMNEYTNFCAGPCEPPEGPVIFDYTNDLPYNPSADGIEKAAIPLNCTHIKNISEADVHVYTGFLQTQMTYAFLKKIHPRPFIVTRSITLGSNKYGFHWTGDNEAKWEFLRSSIADNFNNQLFGMQMQGADICGFAGNTTVELCARWFQLGSMYTFARNHNQDGGNPQEPYAMGQDIKECAKVNLRLRYALLKYMYNLFIMNKGIGTIWRPLFFEFQTDNTSYDDEIVDTQFLLGSFLMGVPIVEQGKTSREVYFPKTSWYDLHTGKRHGPGTSTISNIGLRSPIPLYAREGSIIFMQDSSKVTRVSQLNNEFTLLSGLTYHPQSSNSTHKQYSSVGKILSIQDYSDDTKLDRCFENWCEYRLFMKASITPDHKVLQLNATYFGDTGLQELIVINEIRLNYGGNIVVIPLTDPIKIQGPTKAKVDIPDQSTNLLTEQ